MKTLKEHFDNHIGALNESHGITLPTGYRVKPSRDHVDFYIHKGTRKIGAVQKGGSKHTSWTYHPADRRFDATECHYNHTSLQNAANHVVKRWDAREKGAPTMPTMYPTR